MRSRWADLPCRPNERKMTRRPSPGPLHGKGDGMSHSPASARAPYAPAHSGALALPPNDR